MPSITFQYKCRHCGEIFSGASTEKQVSEEYLLSLLLNSKGIGPVIGPSPLPSLELHDCIVGGNIGIGDIVGYCKEKSR